MLIIKQGQQPLRCLFGCCHLNPRKNLSYSPTVLESSLPASASSSRNVLLPKSRESSTFRVTPFNRAYAATATALLPEPVEQLEEQVVPGEERPKQRERSLKRRRGKSSGASLANAKKLAQQLTKELKYEPDSLEAETVEVVEDEGTIFPPDRVEDHPALTAAPISESPVLADLMRKHPDKPPRHGPNDPEYVKPYRRLYGSIENAFTRKQLGRMSVEMRVQTTSALSKAVTIPLIMKQWGWEAPQEKVQAKAREAMGQQSENILLFTVERLMKLM